MQQETVVLLCVHFSWCIGRQFELFCSTTASCLHLADDPAVLSSESQSVLFFDTYSGRVFSAAAVVLGHQTSTNDPSSQSVVMSFAFGKVLLGSVDKMQMCDLCEPESSVT